MIEPHHVHLLEMRASRPDATAADVFAAREIDHPPCAPEGPAPERKPAAGWARVGHAYFLSGPIECMVHEDEHASDDAPWFWSVRASTSDGRLILIVNDDQMIGGHRPTIDAAQLAAEDALRSIGEEILRAVGK